ncbi:uncharacterized protein PHALS_06929 [Plasmopara halstedii]|uniref:Uncharacterized protein n=1 Tax=Plasmopara halstedii TaxID=4781 RepID=A0A0P1B5R8_PLAHL|nr:uncharacterized protein PHALS_06929 [Plasmopara halstedii]CEG49150.1 hypothetical protein PHALS_06929 [Plasmopara halstedii]|eukprot:XP_024585519.1 hypothetical protein PHALS_06929 [Plasmopara halstedii]
MTWPSVKVRTRWTNRTGILGALFSDLKSKRLSGEKPSTTLLTRSPNEKKKNSKLLVARRLRLSNAIGTRPSDKNSATLSGEDVLNRAFE